MHLTRHCVFRPVANRSYRLCLVVSLAALVFSACGRSERPAGLPGIREVFIPMPDGVQLAADLYVPHDFDASQQYPIILEYLPYRKDEHRRSRYGVFNYFVQHGYLVARVDIRGTGRSQGVIVPCEYSDQELDDGEEVIRYLSQQGYSNGNIAVFGISWGGFNALQLAMRKPPALKTIISLMSTDDLYQDDVHFMDGILHVDAYEIGRDMDNAMPASPDFILDSAYFRQRFQSEPWLLKYKKQQRDGPFWDRASLDGQYADFDTPTFLIAGLYDGYRDLVERFLDRTNGPKRAIIGPWNHTWPHTADPAPAVEWRREVVDWLDRWMFEPREQEPVPYPELVFYQREYHPPGGDSDSLSGTWRVVNSWSNYKRDKLHLNFHSSGKTLSRVQPEAMARDTVSSRPSDGMEGGGPVMWWGDWPPDQAPFDEKSLVYDLPVERELSIAGYPRVHLCAASGSGHVNWFIRLNDVAPDGRVTQVTGAGFNSTHLPSASAPASSPVGSPYCKEIELHWTTWTFKPGHTLRVSISNAQWPMFWPAPEAGPNLILTGGETGSSLSLPLLQEDLPEGYAWEPMQPDPELPEFGMLSEGTASGFAEVNKSTYDSLTQTRRVTAINEWEETFPWATYRNHESIIHSCSDTDPAHTSVKAEYGIDIQLPQRVINLQTELLFTSDADSFYYDYSRSILENGALLKTMHWKEQFARDFQ